MRVVSVLAVILSLAALTGCHHPPSLSASLWDHPWRMGKMSAVRLGPDFELSSVTPLAELTSSPARWIDKTVRTWGRIASVCDEGGCWIDIWPLNGQGGQGVLVNARKKLFSNPLDSSGRIAEVEGRFFVQTVPQKRLRHWAHHGWRPGTEGPTIEGPMKVYRIEATTVEIR